MRLRYIGKLVSSNTHQSSTQPDQRFSMFAVRFVASKSRNLHEHTKAVHGKIKNFFIVSNVTILIHKTAYFVIT